jgi:hypothetical protein
LKIPCRGRLDGEGRRLAWANTRGPNAIRFQMRSAMGISYNKVSHKNIYSCDVGMLPNNHYSIRSFLIGSSLVQFYIKFELSKRVWMEYFPYKDKHVHHSRLCTNLSAELAEVH